MTTMTKAAFLQAYREYVLKHYGAAWASDQSKVDKLMTAVETTLTTQSIPWTWNSDGAKATWKAIGGKGSLTLKALRALT